MTTCRQQNGPPRRPGRGGAPDGGQVAGIEVLPVLILIFVAGSLLLANAWSVVDARMIASSAASRAVHAYAESPVGLNASAAWARAAEIGNRAFLDAGADPRRTALTAVLDPGPLRCGQIVVEASVTVAGIVLPWLGDFGTGVTVRARRSALVDPYRSGLDGDGCA